MSSAPKAPDAVVDALIRELREAGVPESDGRFTLDREEARRKLQAYQLADPHQYLLLLVQVAVLKGATEVAVETGRRRTRIRFDGRPLVLRDFDELWNSLFARVDDQDDWARQELALALNAAGALAPPTISVRSGDGESGVRLEMVSGEPDRFEPDPAPIQGTEIELTIASPTEELAERGRYASIPLVIDGKTCSGGLTLPEVGRPETITAPGIAGQAGFAGLSQEPAWLDLVHHGIRIERRPLPRAPRGFVAVVESSSLRKDLSQTAVLRDDTFREVSKLVDDACDRAVMALVDQLDAEDAADIRPWRYRVLADACWRFRKLGDTRAEGTPANRPLAEAPIWLTAFPGGGLGRRSLADLEELSSRGELSYDAGPLTRPRSGSRVHLPELQDVELFTRLFGRIEGHTVHPSKAQPPRPMRRKIAGWILGLGLGIGFLMSTVCGPLVSPTDSLYFYGKETRGKITSLDEDDSIEVEFEVNGNRREAHDTCKETDSSGIDCDGLFQGGTVLVAYHPQDPSSSQIGGFANVTPPSDSEFLALCGLLLILLAACLGGWLWTSDHLRVLGQSSTLAVSKYLWQVSWWVPVIGLALATAAAALPKDDAAYEVTLLRQRGVETQGTVEKIVGGRALTVKFRADKASHPVLGNCTAGKKEGRFDCGRLTAVGARVPVVFLPNNPKVVRIGAKKHLRLPVRRTWMFFSAFFLVVSFVLFWLLLARSRRLPRELAFEN